MADQVVISFAALLRRLRVSARMTQEELALAAGIHARTISDLERGVALRAQKSTIQLLADALELGTSARAEFEATARGRQVPGGPAIPAGDGESPDSVPGSWLRRIVAALDQLGVGAARSLVTEWQAATAVDAAWLGWVNQLIGLTAAGRLDRCGQRPLPATGGGLFLGRDRQTAELKAFLERVRLGRGGLALVVGPVGIGKSRLLVEVLADWRGTIQPDWVTLDRAEAGYRGWRRLLAPRWIEIRRAELAPASLLPYAGLLDDVLLSAGDGDEIGSPFPGEVAAGLAALMNHMARRGPAIFVLDDAHRGGVTSDQLLVEVARRVSASAVGIVAALRRSELEEPSPLRTYADQGANRAAADLVVPVHLPPLDRQALAGLIEERTGAAPPQDVIDQVLTQTGGRPQLVKYSPVRPPDSGSPSGRWVVGRPAAQDLRDLQSIVVQRSEETQDVLYAAAVCATGQQIDPALLARVTQLPVDEIERILDEELRRASILAARASGYWFDHDSWVDALIACCPPARFHALHARCVVVLGSDPSCDPQVIARHAIAAGAAVVGAETLVALARKAADSALADHAFGAAAEFCMAAAQHADGLVRIELLIAQADALRFGGGWDDARAVLKRAASLAQALGELGHEALALLHLERLTWSYGLYEQDLTAQIRNLLERLPADEAVLRAQVQAGLAGRLGIAARQYENEQIDLAKAALEKLPSVPPSLARADILAGVRNGLRGSAPPGELLEYDRQILDLGMRFHSGYHIAEALVYRIVDLLGSGRVLDVPAAVRAHRAFAEKSAAQLTLYSQALIDGMLALASGDFPAASAYTAEAASLSADWGDSMAHEALTAQAGWLLLETGELNGLAEVLAGLPDQNVSAVNEPIWHLGAGLIHAERGEVAPASRMLREVSASTADFATLAGGPSRIGILATAATLVGHPVLCDSLPHGDAVRWGRNLAALLADHPDSVVIAGWPAVILGSKHRFIGLARLAAGQPAEAVTHLMQAAEQNAEFAVLHARTRFDLARALVRQPPTRPDGIAELQQAKLLAAGLGMAGLAGQASAELDRWARRP